MLTAEIARVLAYSVYEPTVFFVRNQGFVTPTAARQIRFEHSVAFERIHEQTYQEYGFRLIDVPGGPLPGRGALVLEAVERLRGRAGHLPHSRRPVEQ